MGGSPSPLLPSALKMTPNNKDTEKLTQQYEGRIKKEQISHYPFMKSLIHCRKYGCNLIFMVAMKKLPDTYQ